MNRLVAVFLVVALTTPAVAAPRKVLVLPLDGSAPAETRKKLSASFQRMARVLDGEVQNGNTSLADTATAIGCDPDKATCIENVRATLGVDELVYGNADEEAGTITVIAKRYRKGKPLRELTVTQAATEPPNKIEPQLLPVFGNEPLPAHVPEAVVEPEVTAPVEPLAQPQPALESAPSPRRARNLWIGVTAGGGLLTAIGLALWAQAGSLQDDIDSADTDTSNDIDELRDLEDRASSRAWAGNIFVFAGLAVVGYGVYRLFTLPATSVTITPAPTEGGAAVFVGARW
jgi:hypothetical protein